MDLSGFDMYAQAFKMGFSGGFMKMGVDDGFGMQWALKIAL